MLFRSFNLVCAWFLITSYLVTTYQQYTSYMEAMGFDPAAEKTAIKKKGNILKRIIKAIKEKKKRKILAPTLVNDALKNMKNPNWFESNPNKNSIEYLTDN